jgi:hypothetical protein
LKSESNPFAVPFPSGWFHPRCRAPLAHRLGAVAEYRLGRCKQAPLPPKPKSNLHYITMASRGHWLLLRESLVSLHRTWQSLPILTVVSDGSWKKDEFIGAFDFWPNAIRVLMPDEILEPLAKAGQSALVELAKAHPLGLKLAAIILFAQQEAILFVDSDILWFSDPGKIIERSRGVKGPVTSVETGSSYNERLIQQFCPEGLFSPGINTGCVYLQGELCEREMFQKLLAAALEDSKHNFNEQTIIAIAVQKNGRRFPAELCLVDFTDAAAFKRKRPWQNGVFSRHYVNWMRHQFYRDAITLRQNNQKRI